MSQLPPRDDVDRAFERLGTLPPPRGFAAGVMATIASRQAVRLSAVWLAAAAAGVLAVLALGYWLGLTLVGGGLLDLIGTLVAEGDLLLEAPGEVLLALVEAVPWLELLALGLALAALAYAVRHVTHTAAFPLGRQRAASAERNA